MIPGGRAGISRWYLRIRSRQRYGIESIRLRSDALRTESMRSPKVVPAALEKPDRRFSRGILGPGQHGSQFICKKRSGETRRPVAASGRDPASTSRSCEDADPGASSPATQGRSTGCGGRFFESPRSERFLAGGENTLGRELRPRSLTRLPSHSDAPSGMRRRSGIRNQDPETVQPRTSEILVATRTSILREPASRRATTKPACTCPLLRSSQRFP